MAAGNQPPVTNTTARSHSFQMFPTCQLAQAVPPPLLAPPPQHNDLQPQDLPAQQRHARCRNLRRVLLSMPATYCFENVFLLYCVSLHCLMCVLSIFLLLSSACFIFHNVSGCYFHVCRATETLDHTLCVVRALMPTCVVDKVIGQSHWARRCKAPSHLGAPFPLFDTVHVRKPRSIKIGDNFH